MGKTLSKRVYRRTDRERFSTGDCCSQRVGWAADGASESNKASSKAHMQWVMNLFSHELTITPTAIL
jgi:hypothetical protein